MTVFVRQFLRPALRETTRGTAFRLFGRRPGNVNVVPLALALVLIPLSVTAVFAQGPPDQGALVRESGERTNAPGALLDDYETPAAGTATITFGAGYLKVPDGYDVWAPSTSLMLGLTDWLSVSGYSSLSKNQFETFGTTAVGDTYVSAKIRLVREGEGRPGIAVQPVLEVLGRPSLANNPRAPDKVNAALGGIIGKNLWDTLRVYNHTGYFTRGIVFNSAAVEITRFSHITPVVWATFGALTDNRTVAAEIGANASRLNVGGTLGFRMSQNWTGWVNASRSLGRRDFNSTDISVGGGISYAMRMWE